MPGIGAMRERITIQEEVQTSDGQGGYTLSWDTVKTLAAQVTPMNGRERMVAQQVQAELAYRIRIRYRTDITPKMRVVWGEKTMNIREVFNGDEKRQYLHLICEEGVGE